MHASFSSLLLCAQRCRELRWEAACLHFLAFECSPKVAFEVLGELVSLGWAFKWATIFFPFQYNAVVVKPALLGLR